MKLGSSKGIKTGQWLANEILRNDDINFLAEATYQNVTDLIAMIAEPGKATGSTKDLVMSGLLLEWNNLLTCDFRAGSAVSYSGRYITAGVWGFTATAGEIFSAIVPQDASITFDTGNPSNPRIDLLEIRPILNQYNSIPRQFKDPITGLITSANVNTRREYGYEFQIKKGTPAPSPVALSKTSGWIKIAEVTIPTSATAITQDNIKDVRDSLTWTTEESATKLRISAYIQTLMDDPDAVTARLTLDCLQKTVLPIGCVLMYKGTGIDVPDTRTEKLGARTNDSQAIKDAAAKMEGDWYVCNGQSSTPDIRNRFIRAESASGSTGGEDTHTLTIAEMPAHSHLLVPSGNAGSSTGTPYALPVMGAGSASPTSTQTVGGGTAHENKPVYYSLIFIIRMA